MSARPLRIVLVSQEYPPETARGGIGSQTYAKAHGLAALGHDVRVLSHSIDSERHEYVTGNVRVTRIPSADQRLAIHTEQVRWLSYSVEVAAVLERMYAEQPIDIIDSPEWACESYTYLLNRTSWNHVPCVIQLHGPLVMLAHTIGWPGIDSEFYRVGTAMEAACLRLADAVYSSSRCSADWCARHYDLKQAAIPVLHTGVDIQRFRPDAARKAERLTIVFVGKLVPNKGVDILVRSACELAKEFPNMQVRLLGRDSASLLERMQNQASEAGFPRLIDAPGFVGRDELPVQLASSHVLAVPSEYEGGPGFVYLEAMACGIPVIACAGSGAAEVVRHGENGLLVPPRDVKALTATLRQLLSNADERNAMGRCGRQFVETEADSAKCIRRLEELYRSVVERRA